MCNIKVSASSANLGSGFDVLGLALGLYNEYTFEKADCFNLSGFDERYLNIDNNLVLSSYLKAFEIKNEIPEKVKITEILSEIPRTDGLGSSAACVVAGLRGANLFLKNKLSNDELFELATIIEGHPDNVAATVFGGLNACYKTAEGYKHQNYKVSSNLKFLVCCPDFYVSTLKARQVLPKKILFNKAVENLSHIVNLPRAFETGDIKLLKESVKDNLHEPYRFNLIPEGDKFKKLSDDIGAVAVISGSGASLLIISDNESYFEKFYSLKTEHKWRFISVIQV